MDDFFPVLIIGVLVSTLIGGLIGNTKGRAGESAFFGFLLGPLGWLIIALGPSFNPKCPFCKGDVVSDAVKCRNCGSDLKPA